MFKDSLQYLYAWNGGCMRNGVGRLESWLVAETCGITKESRRELIVKERVDGCSHLNLLF